MLASSIIIQIIFSLFIIFIIHYFYNYIKDTYSTKKTKDIVGFQVQKYQEIIQEMQRSKFIPTEDQERMKSELLELVQSD
jgi:hypothetical protein